MRLPTIPLLSTYLSKSKAAWLAGQEAQLRVEFAPQLAAIQVQLSQQVCELQKQSERFATKSRELQQQVAQLSDQELLLADRKVAVEKANEELRTQLRLLEAKAAPDSVWVEAFSRGYEKAWDAMWPVMSAGVSKMQEAIETKAIEATLHRLDRLIGERAQQLGVFQPQTTQVLLEKQSEFQRKQASAQSKDEKVKYEHYLTALGWMLNANGVHSHQPTT